MIYGYSDQGGDQQHHGNESNDVVFWKHGADNGAGSLVGSDEVGGDLGNECEDEEESNDEFVHLIDVQ